MGNGIRCEHGGEASRSRITRHPESIGGEAGLIATLDAGSDGSIS